MFQIYLSNISKSFKGSFLFKNVDLCGEAGQIIAIKGKSGVGKSTLLNIIAGLETPTSGSYQLDGINMLDKDINELARIRGKKLDTYPNFHQ